MLPIISVITVTLNDLTGLQRTVDNVSNQKRDDIEQIVIDGGSTDGSVAYLEGLCRTQLSWVSESDRGIYDGMNKGVSRATGRYIVFLNSGDVFASDDVGSFLCKLLSDPNISDAGVIFCSAYLCVNGKPVVLRRARNFSCIWHGVPANHQATVYKRSCMPHYPSEFSICGDYFAAASLYASGVKSAVVERAVVLFQLGGVSSTHGARLCREAWVIQRQVLGLGFIIRSVSLARRCVAIFCVKMMSVFHGGGGPGTAVS